MSLVAYGNSDESDNSDSDEGSPPIDQKRPPPGPTSIAGGERSLPAGTVGTARPAASTQRATSTVDDIVEEDEPMVPIQRPELGLRLPPPKHESQGDIAAFNPLPKRQSTEVKEVPLSSTGSILDEDDLVTKPSLLSGLPLPKASESSVAFIADDVVEDELKEKAAKLAATAAKPPAKLKKRQPVKITVPDISQYDSDEEDEPKEKKTKPASGKAGLFSLLPAPKHTSVKTTNRPLLPYTLSKKPAQNTPISKKTVPAVAKISKPVKRLPGVPDEDSDEDGEDAPSASNFFSLGSSSKVQLAAPSPQLNLSHVVAESGKLEPSLRGPWQGPAAQASSLLGPGLTVTDNRQPKSSSVDTSQGPGDMDLGMASSESQIPTGSTRLSDAPLAFSSKSQQWGPGPSYQAVGVSTAGSSGQATEDEAVQYPNYTEANVATIETPSGEVENFLQDDEFLKLAGKRQRGREAIDIIDVCADDQTSSVDLTKNLTEETSGYSHSRKRKDLPSAQQRRKHHITYLAFQAKERELELKNQWSQNRATRKQTQSKYGF